MRYRDFGNLGYKVSALGFGAMRLPETASGCVDRDRAVALIRAALDAGINYVDTAPLYNRGASEPVVGEALKDGYRDRVWLSTKNLLAKDDSPAAWRERLEQQLERLQTPYLDVYHFWGISWEIFRDRIAARGLIDAARAAQADGLFRHLFFSFHAPAEDFFKLVDTGEFAGCTVQYNLIDTSLEGAIAYAASKEMAVVVMGPVGGGRLAGPSPLLEQLPVAANSNAELALRFVLANPNVHCAISGMSTLEMLAENVAAASRAEPLTTAELAAIAAHMEEYHALARLYCTGCNYCQPCPEKVAVPRVLNLFNLARVYGFEEAARNLYREIGQTGFYANMQNGAACVGCGDCLDKCPQKLDIPGELARAHAALAKDE